MTTFSAVTTTGIYCRPGCGARPLAENVRTFELAAAAEAAGFRACLRCRPYRVAGPVTANAPELVCRAVQLIIDGVLDESGEDALAARLAISARHLRRLFNDHLGATPDQLARSRRAHFARRLLDDSDLPVAEVAFASGFGSLRQFNRDMRTIFRASPKELRDRRRKADRLTADGGLVMRLPFQPPYDWDATAGFLASHTIPGVDSVIDSVYRRTIDIDGAPGMLEIEPGDDDHLLLRAHLPYWEGLIHIVERAGRMVGVDTAPASAVPHAESHPAIRVPVAWSAFEAAVQEIAAQHQTPESVATLVQDLGHPVPGLPHGLTHLFPSPEVLATSPLPLPGPAATAVQSLAKALITQTVTLDHGTGPDTLITALHTVPGITETTAHNIALRLGHPGALPHHA